ncbi:Uncharacterized protein HZ326_5164 [Fusarium oxysporum f. sp. albedinis]|nr:Uncharacterized protein HZ326_5164 [Fusarium oxysporum f. sp. albedinis]
MNRCRHCNRQEPSIIAEIYYICMLIKWDTTSMWDRVLYCHSVIECIVIIVELWIHSLLHCEYDESLCLCLLVSPISSCRLQLPTISWSVPRTILIPPPPHRDLASTIQTKENLPQKSGEKDLTLTIAR